MITGKDDFQRERCKRGFLNLFASSGGDVEEVSPNRLRIKLSSRAFFAGSCLFVLQGIDQDCYDLLLRHKNSPFQGVVVLVVVKENVRKDTLLGRLSANIGQKKHRRFDPVPPHKQFDTASDFLTKEIRESGLKVSGRVCRKIVSDVGTDLGFLSFQSWKLINLAKQEGLPEIGEDLAERISLQAFEAPMFPMIEAIGFKQPVRCLKEMWKIQKTHLSPAIKICRFVGSFLVKWGATKNLVEREVPEKDAVKLLAVSNWYYQNKLCRISANWTHEELAKLASICSETEEAVFSGQIDPWTFFCSKTYNLLASSRS